MAAWDWTNSNTPYHARHQPYLLLLIFQTITSATIFFVYFIFNFDFYYNDNPKTNVRRNGITITLHLWDRKIDREINGEIM